jgi:flagellar biogenesis protein FliO
MGRGTLKTTRLWSIALVAWVLTVPAIALNAQVQEETPLDDTGASTEENRPDENEFRFAGGESGAEGDGAGGAADGEDLSAFGLSDLLRMVLVLLMVVGAVYGVVAFLRRRIPATVGESDSPIRVLASRNLGANKDLHAVMIGPKVIIVGGGEASLRLITTVEDQETIDELILAASAVEPRQRTFGSLLGGWLNNMAVPGSKTDASSDVNGGSGPGGNGSGESSQIRSFLHLQQERLRKLR